MDEHQVAIVSFEGAIKREVKLLRYKFQAAANAGLLPSNFFHFAITAKGRMTDGEIKIEFTLFQDEYGTGPVRGHSSQAVSDEFLRRAGWQAVNTPIAIGFDKVVVSEVPGEKPDDEIPF